jgi:molybdopterin converting factor small subunit
MVIHIRLLGPYAKFGSGLEKGTLSLKKGARVKDVVHALRIPPHNIRLILVNGHWSDLRAELSEGDNVKFFPPMGGG